MSDSKGFKSASVPCNRSLYAENEVICGAEEDFLREQAENEHLRSEYELSRRREYLINGQTLEDRVTKAMHEFESFGTDDTMELERFIRYGLQTRILRSVYADKKMPYNLILECNDRDRALEFADKLRRTFNIEGTVFVSEPDPYDPADIEMEKLQCIGKSGCGMAVIHSNYEMPDEDSKNFGAGNNYKVFWNTVEKTITECPDTLFVIIAAPEIVKGSLCKRRHLYDNAASHHLKLSGYTDEQVYLRSLERLKDCGYSTGQKFKTALRKYIERAYPASCLTGTAFINGLVNTVTANFFSVRSRCDNRLTADTLPEFQTPARAGVFNELDNMVGLSGLKDLFKKIVSQADYAKSLMNEGIKLDGYNRHMAFIGNPGTGKTSVGKMTAKILYAYGVIRSDKFTYLERKDLVGKYIGSTEDKVKKLLKEAFGGVIMIDEAYALSTGEESDCDDRRDFGNRVIEILITAMDEHKDDTVFIFAGYPEPMDKFIGSNPGFRSRIGYMLNFSDYTPDELTEIFRRKLTGKGLVVEEDALEKVRDLMEFYHTMPCFGNGRFVESVIGHTFEKKAMGNYKSDLRTIRKKDIPDIKDMAATVSPDLMPAELDMSKKDRYRTAVHELGHAVASIKTGRIPAKISIVSRFDSTGRVENEKPKETQTESDYKNILISVLSGKNAEKVILGEHSAGCMIDYMKAKSIAICMVNNYAMGEIGVTSGNDFLIEADTKSMEIMEEYKDFIKKTARELLGKEEMSGKELAALM